MPSTKDHRQIGIEFLGFPRNRYGFADHRSCHQRNRETQSILKLVEDALLKSWRNRRINDSDLIACAKQRSSYRQNPKRGSRLETGEGREKEDYLSRAH